MADTLPHAPVRTYGRARRASPDNDAPSLFAPRTTAAPAETGAPSSRQSPGPSPSKKLLDSFQTGHSAWRARMAALDSVDHGEAEDEAALKQTAQRLRRERQLLEGSFGLPSPAEMASIEATRRPGDKSSTLAPACLNISFSSSSLSSAPPAESEPALQPTSTPPSSPPVAARDAGRAVKATISALFSETSNPPTPAIAKTRQRSEEGEESSRSSPRSSPLRRSPTPEAESSAVRSTESTPRARLVEKDDQAASASPSPSGSPIRPAASRKSRIEDFMSQLRDEPADDSHETQDRRTSPLAGMDDLFEDEEEPQGKKGKKQRGPKALNKKDADELRKDMDRAQRERYVSVQKTEVTRFPLNSFLDGLAGILTTQPEPTLTRSLTSPPSSAFHQTPTDDIGEFTPSSPAVKAGLRIPHGDASTTPIPQSQSSPSVNLRKAKPIPTRDDDDDLDFDIRNVFDTKEMGQARLKLVKAKALRQQQLKDAERKKAALTAAGVNDNEDDDFLEVVKDDPKPAPAKTARFALPPSNRGEQDPRSALANYRSKHTGGTLPRSVAPKAAGRAQKTLTETHVEFAAKQIDHANLRSRNGGSRPAGQKAGRDQAIDREAWERQLQEQSRLQAARARQEKERQFGRGRVLPPKQTLDLQGLITSSMAAGSRSVEDDEDDDPEDEDYHEEGDDEDDDAVAYSGEEEEGGDESGEEEAEDEDQGDAHAEAADDDDKENQPIVPATSTADADKQTPPLKTVSTPGASTEIVLDSAERPSSAQPSTETSRQPLTDISGVKGAGEVSAFASDAFGSAPTASPGFGGFGGFGDDGGFSQMFEATQIGSTAGEHDAFAALRAAPDAALLPTNALLPQVNISDTQAERDNALVAAEAEAEISADREVDRDQPQNLYLNEHGFFTQTKPAARPTPQSASRVPLGPRGSDWSLNGLGTGRSHHADADEEMGEPGTGRRGSSATDADSQDGTVLNPSSPEKQVGSSRNDLPNHSAPGSPVAGHGATDEADSAHRARPSNALERMMAAAQREKRREERRREREKFRSDLVDEQAEESDEDNGWLPFGGKDDGDEDEEGEDDGFVDGLVDDQAIDAEEQRRQDELAEEKRREIELADDAKREEAARGVIAGEQRIKKRGADFLDGEDGEDEPAYKLSKKQRKLLRKMRKGDEATPLLDYLQREAQDDFDSDGDDWESQEPQLVASPQKMSRREEMEMEMAPLPTNKTTQELLQEIGRKNRGKNLDTYDEDQDAELFGRTSRSRAMDMDVSDSEIFEDASYTVKRDSRVAISVSKLAATRSSSSISTRVDYSEYVRVESQVNRRAGGAPGGVSVVRPSSASSFSGRSGSGSGGGRQTGAGAGRALSRQSTTSSASILSSRGSKFV